VTLPSLFEEQIEFEAEKLAYFLEYAPTATRGNDVSAALSEFRREPKEYVEHIRRASQAVAIRSSPASTASAGRLTDYARQFEQAGAAAIELNVYYIATNPALAAPKWSSATLTCCSR